MTDKEASKFSKLIHGAQQKRGFLLGTMKDTKVKNLKKRTRVIK